MEFWVRSKLPLINRLIGFILLATTLVFCENVDLERVSSDFKFSTVNSPSNGFAAYAHSDYPNALMLYANQSHNDFVVSKYNDDRESELNRKISKYALIAGIPAFIAGVGLTMGCEDTETPDRFCRQRSTKIGTKILGFGGMFCIAYGIFGLILFRKD